MSDPKPCPFCGSEEIALMFEDGLFWEECSDCGGRASKEYTRKAAERSWNERADL